MSAHNELDPSYRCLVDLVQALDRRARQWYHYGMAARASHWDTLVRVRPYVVSGQISEEVLDTSELTLPDTMALPSVGGVVPRHGPFIPPRGEPAETSVKTRCVRISFDTHHKTRKAKTRTCR